MLLGCGLPIMFMEQIIGQYSSEGALSVWKLAPIFKGLGVAAMVCSCMCSIYYNMITGWALYYLLLSIREVLPWRCCVEPWATPHCVSFASDCVSESQIDRPRRDTITSLINLINSTDGEISVNGTDIINSAEEKRVNFAADDFFHYRILHIGDGVTNVESVEWELVLALTVAWLIVFLVLVKGIKSVGKVVYFTSTFPYFVLLALLLNAVKEPGAIDGITYYLKPNFTKLTESSVWGEAAAQVFYSTGACLGGTVTLASYNRFHHDMYRDSVIVIAGDSFTSIFSGLVVFSILGGMAHSQNTTVEKVATDGPGLTFITYPQSVVLSAASPVWSFLFFAMLVTLALSTMFPTVENVSSALIDQFSATLRPYKFWVSMAVCATLYGCGLPLATPAGMYILQLLDQYAVGYALLILGFIELIAVAWVFGADKLLDNAQQMLGYRPSRIWILLWRIIAPGLLAFAICSTIADLKILEYRDYPFPPGATIAGGVLTCISVAPVPLVAAYVIYRGYRGSLLKRGVPRGTRPNCGTLTEAMHKACEPVEWRPAVDKYRMLGNAKFGEPDDDDVFA